MTDECNFNCTGCYRRNVNGHKTLDAIRAEVRMLKRLRNVDSISLAGGEPILHPQIREIVAAIAREGLKSFMLSNGHGVTADLLRDLVAAGLTGIGFHVDSMQNRPGWAGRSERDMNELRQQYAEMAHGVRGLPPVGFGMTVYPQNLTQVPDVVRWAIGAHGIVGGVSFITYRAAVRKGFDYFAGSTPVDPWTGLGYLAETADEVSVRSTDVSDVIAEAFSGFAACAFLGGTQTHEARKWLDGLLLCAGKEVLGSLGSRSMEFMQVVHHLLFGTYVVYTRGRMSAGPLLLLSLVDPRVRSALGRFLRNPFRRVFGLSIGIVQAPDLLPDGRVDMCESCPDMTFFDGRLVNSCRLDEHRLYGGLLSAVPRMPAQVQATFSR
ncbi:MAG: hypothetical protein A2177_12845 [Spirochaetes bacterium RBG_13_68_11]|nr:MAG: hypothetical protein A2177_12845 [Spirochaetes bacterium RBG_13_68_11]